MIPHFQTNLHQKMPSTKCPSKKILLISVNAKISKKTTKKNQDKDITKNPSNGSVEDTSVSKSRQKHFTLPFPTLSSLLVSKDK